MPKILLVEDDVDILESTRFTMEAMGYECITANNGMDGYKKAVSEKPDLTVLDMMMPIMTGMEVLQKIRQEPLVKSLPVIMLTAVSDKKNVRNILALGVKDYVIKPFDINVLVQKVQNVLGTPDEQIGLTEEDDITTLTLNQKGQNISDAIIDAFAQMAKFSREGKQKFVMNFGNLDELTNADLRRVGDGIGIAAEERCDIKFVISSDKIKSQFEGFYETQDADIYKTLKEAILVFKKQDSVRIVEREGILILSSADTDATFFSILKQMFECVDKHVLDGKKKYVLSFADFFDFDRVDMSATKLIVDSCLEFRRKGIDIRFVFPSRRAKEWFKNVSEGIAIDFYMSDDEAVEKLGRECVFTLEEKGELTILKLIENLNVRMIWNALKSVFRNIFELSDEGKKQFAIDFGNLKSMDSRALKLLEGAIANLSSNGVIIKFITDSLILKEQLVNFQGTRDIEVLENQEVMRK